MSEILLFFLGLLTGFIGVNSGGSALMNVPIMIFFGLPPQSAIATSRIAAVGSMAAGLHQFHKMGKVDYAIAAKTAIFSAIGSVLGAYLLLSVPTHWLERSIALLTISFTLLSFLRKKETEYTPPSRLATTVGYLSFLLTGVIAGFFGGQGVLATYLYLFFFNKSFSESVGTRKVSGLAAALPALCLYGFNGIIHWTASLSLVAGSLFGSVFGSRYALKKGDAWIQRLFTTVSILLSVKMLFF